MQRAKYVWIFGGLLTIFGLFAVYSTSIWKSFDQGSRVTIVKNIETINAFDYLLEETISKPTQKILSSTGTMALITPPMIGSGTTNTSPLPQVSVQTGTEIVQTPEELLKLEEGEGIKLVSIEKKTIKNRDNYKYFSNQLRSLIISLIFVLVLFFIPIKSLENSKIIWILLIGVTLFQLLVFVPGLEARYGTSRGRIDIPGLPNMQPSEFFKIGYMFFMAYWISKRKDFIDSNIFLTQFATVNGIVFLVLLSIPDFGTIFILGVSATIMSRYYGLSLKRIGILVSIALGVLAIGSVVIGFFNSKYGYALARITSFMTTDAQEQQYQEKHQLWQIKQGILAVGGGGFRGQGYGKGLQKMGYLPESHSDMIFDAFSEEIGFFGNMILLGLYFGLFYNVILGLKNVKNPYFELAGVGLISLLIVQVFVHIGVNLGILPNTGLTLPFISHGGTGLMINFIQLTLLYKILTNK